MSIQNFFKLSTKKIIALVFFIIFYILKYFSQFLIIKLTYTPSIDPNIYITPKFFIILNLSVNIVFYLLLSLLIINYFKNFNFFLKNKKTTILTILIVILTDIIIKQILPLLFLYFSINNLLNPYFTTIFITIITIILYTSICSIYYIISNLKKI
jgi:hypothetical protein